ncbi:MAG: glutaredoxin family protein [Desulfobacteraceae bacterium]|nr:glutaredoxin family protein [Desulfobacteraceae bacterium]
MTEKKILIYTLSTCSHCKSTKKFLSECNVAYNNITVDDLKGEERKKAIEDIKKLNPLCSFPTTKINDTIIVGYKEKQIREALGITND